jgi:hypothetical protein
MTSRNSLAVLLGLLSLTAATGCDEAYPEVVVVNRIDEHVLIKNPSFNGCVWNTVLAKGEATAPGQCLPGEDRVHFQRYDAAAYCREQAEDRTLDGICPCDPTPSSADGGVDAGTDAGLTDEEPRWFNYQTISVKRVDYGDFWRFDITLDDMEQDFSVPGPYGH